jgi:hypothetical protein
LPWARRPHRWCSARPSLVGSSRCRWRVETWRSRQFATGIAPVSAAEARNPNRSPGADPLTVSGLSAAPALVGGCGAAAARRQQRPSLQHHRDGCALWCTGSRVWWASPCW